MRKLLFALPVILLIAASCNNSTSLQTPQQQTSQEPANSKQSAQATPNQNPSPTPTSPSKTSPQPSPSEPKTITLNAATKLAVTQAIIKGLNILASKDATKIRNYFETEYLGTNQAAQFKAMTDAQLLQLAQNAITNTGIPDISLATDSAATWQVDGDIVKVTHKSYAAPDPKYPAIADLNVTYQARFINNSWY